MIFISTTYLITREITYEFGWCSVYTFFFGELSLNISLTMIYILNLCYKLNSLTLFCKLSFHYISLQKVSFRYSTMPGITTTGSLYFNREGLSVILQTVVTTMANKISSFMFTDLT